MHSRKDFLRKIGLTLTGATASVVGFSSYADDSDLIEEQKEFLKDYENWLKEFNSYVKKRSQNTLDAKNNMRLMELSEESKERKTILEMYMKDEKFAKYFNEITRNITEAI